MTPNEIRELTTKAADNAFALAVIDKMGNVIVRYFDQVVIEKDAKKAAMLMETIGNIISDSKTQVVSQE